MPIDGSNCLILWLEGNVEKKKSIVYDRSQWLVYGMENKMLQDLKKLPKTCKLEVNGEYASRKSKAINPQHKVRQPTSSRVVSVIAMESPIMALYVSYAV